MNIAYKMAIALAKCNGEPGHHVAHCVSTLIGIAMMLLMLLIAAVVGQFGAGLLGINEKPCVGSFLC